MLIITTVHFRYINLVFLAMQCFSFYKSQNLSRSSSSAIDLEDLEAFAEHAQLEREHHKLGDVEGSSQSDTQKAKWRDITRLGEQMFELSIDFGGLPFLILFPLYELCSEVDVELVQLQSHHYLPIGHD